jgi:hypothetical protein
MLSRKIIPALALTLVLYSSASRAQDQQQDQQQDNAPQAPIPPVQPPDSSDGGAHQLPAPAGRDLFGTGSPSVDTSIGDDSRPLAGAEAFGVGLPTGTHNLFDAALHLSTGGDTGIQPGETNFTLSAGGLAALNHSWSRNQFTAQYSGAETLYRPAAFGDSAFQDLSAEQTIRWRRTTLRLRDDFVQSSGATFGGLSTGGPGLTTAGLTTAVAPTFVPSQTILTGQGDRLSDFILGEVDYARSRRSTLTFAGSYGLLHFLTSGYINSQSEDGRVGYGYKIDRKNTLGFYYDYDNTSYGGGTVASNTIQATYGRLLAARTALQISGGPQFFTSTGGPNTLSWSAYATITQRIRRTNLSASYGRGVTNGSGVLLGSETQTATGSISSVVWRVWNPSITGGYTRNNSLATSTTAAGLAQYANWFGAANFGRLWDRIIQTNFSYGLQRQTQNGGCPVLSCGPATLRQVFTFTVDFHIRPIGIE